MQRGYGTRRPGTLEVPEVVIVRLPIYLRVLSQLLAQGTEVTSSHQLGERLQVTPAQIRKDLSYFGRFGKQGRGYNVRGLLAELKAILGLDHEWRVCLIGVGRLGRAILGYPGFAREGFRICAAFDANPEIVGTTVEGIPVQPFSSLAETVKTQGVRIAVVAVPEAHAQDVINQLVALGIQGILNYAPVAPQVPPHVKVRNIDPVLALQSMTFYIHEDVGAKR